MHEETKKQFARVQRFLEKMSDNKNRSLESYEDDVITFFMHCWHMKDWVENDASFKYDIKKEVEVFCQKSEELQICRDLCHKSKHLKIDDIRRDAEFSNHGTTIHCTMAVLNKDGSSSQVGEGYSELSISVEALTRGNHNGKYPVNINVIDLGVLLVDQWRNFLVEQGVTDA